MYLSIIIIEGINMKLDLTTIDFKKESFISTLQETFKIADAPDILSVSDKDSQTLAEKQITEYKKIGKEFESEIKPLKLKLDNVKKAVLEFEKFQLSKVDTFVISQEKPIKEYKAEILRVQQEAKRKAEEEARRKAEEIRRAEEIRLNEIRKAKQKELEELEKSKVAVSEKIDAIYELKDEIKKVENIVVPEIEVKVEKVVLKKDEIKTKKVYSISDESAYIEWALKHNRSLLNITVNKSEFNRFVKEIEDLPFIKVEEVII
jgi:hypothetical protein